MRSETAVQVEGVSKFYTLEKAPLRRLLALLFRRNNMSRDGESFTALDNVSFTVERGETIGIIGRNGAGKSTLLQVICGTLAADSGSVTTRGRIAALLELGAGFNPEFTGRENVYMNAAIHGLSQRQVDERMESILAFAEIGDFIDQPVKTYSSGMYVRLAFAVIAHLDADILVIDEALAVGDVYFTQKCMRFLREFAERGTLLFVSHDTGSVINLCRRAVWLEGGRVRMVGPAREVANGYLGSFYEDRLNDLDGGDETEKTQAAAEFGLGDGRIDSCELVDPDGQSLNLHDAAGEVCLRVHCRARNDIQQPIVGFYIKDRLGQPLCGTNTYQLGLQWPAQAAGSSWCTEFVFHLPELATGEYTITVALAAGTQESHVQHHWIHEALAFKAKANPHMSGLFVLENMHCRLC